MQNLHVLETNAPQRKTKEMDNMFAVGWYIRTLRRRNEIHQQQRRIFYHPKYALRSSLVHIVCKPDTDVRGANSAVCFCGRRLRVVFGESGVHRIAHSRFRLCAKMNRFDFGVDANRFISLVLHFGRICRRQPHFVCALLPG